jgi:hypothetical protein
MAQGFVIDLNLIESDTGDLDRGILDNLGGTNITTDLLLFDGNFRFISKLSPSDYTYDATSGVITVTGEGKVAFSDGTKISLSDAPTVFETEVFDSNGIDKFKLRNLSGQAVSPLDSSNAKKILRRNDGVSAENISNLSSKRLETNPGASTGISDDDGASDLFNQYSASEQIDYINTQLALYYYKRDRVPLTFEDSSFDQRVNFRGSVMIVDNDATSTTQPSNSTPGLFIVDASNPGGGATRAFSDASNPWSEVGSGNTGALVTTEANTQPNTLSIKPNTTGTNPASSSTPNLQTTSTLIVSQANALSGFNYKLPVEINGERFFLLLKA